MSQASCLAVDGGVGGVPTMWACSQLCLSRCHITPPAQGSACHRPRAALGSGFRGKVAPEHPFGEGGAWHCSRWMGAGEGPWAYASVLQELPPTGQSSGWEKGSPLAMPWGRGMLMREERSIPLERGIRGAARHGEGRAQGAWCPRLLQATVSDPGVVGPKLCLIPLPRELGMAVGGTEQCCCSQSPPFVPADGTQRQAGTIRVIWEGGSSGKDPPAQSSSPPRPGTAPPQWVGDLPHTLPRLSHPFPHPNSSLGPLD